MYGVEALSKRPNIASPSKVHHGKLAAFEAP